MVVFTYVQSNTDWLDFCPSVTAYESTIITAVFFYIVGSEGRWKSFSFLWMESQFFGFWCVNDRFSLSFEDCVGLYSNKQPLCEWSRVFVLGGKSQIHILFLSLFLSPFSISQRPPPPALCHGVRWRQVFGFVSRWRRLSASSWRGRAQLEVWWWWWAFYSEGRDPSVSVRERSKVS